jgi:HEAT repeat protein
MLGHLGCRRALGPLERLLPDLVAKVEASSDYWGGPPERYFLDSILYAIARVDSDRSHAVLARLLRESPSHLVRADVLEAMAFEKESFDVELVLPFASERAETPEILSAIYALLFHDYANRDPERARAVTLPLMTHPYRRVAAYAIEMLQTHKPNLDFILTFADDPDPSVRQSVQEAIRYSEWLD